MDLAFIMRPIFYYMLGTGGWFAGFGIQGVLFAWLVAMELRSSPELLGIAQMCLLLPGTLFMLIGGSIADRLGPHRVVVVACGLAAINPIILIFLLFSDRLNYSSMIFYALMMGTVAAFANPARDGLLNFVASGRVQRTVMIASMVQFSGQLLGFTIAATTDWFGPELVLLFHTLFLVFGVAMFRLIQLPRYSAPSAHLSLANSLKQGAITVFSSSSMRLIVIQNVAMGLFFMGSFVVTIPLLVRDIHLGSSQDLAIMNMVNSFGLLASIFLLFRLGDVQRPGRALILSHILGAIALASVGIPSQFYWAVGVALIWGLSGGIAITMSRTIMQEQAPADQRGRVMSFYGLSFMGSGPLGALLCGYLSEHWGPKTALLICAVGMIAVTLILFFGTKLWQFSTNNYELEMEDGNEV